MSRENIGEEEIQIADISNISGVDRIREIVYRMAFITESMDEASKRDQVAFASFWRKFIHYLELDGIKALAILAKYYSDEQVGVLCLALTRAMSTDQRLKGLQVLANMAYSSAVLCCSAHELKLAKKLIDNLGHDNSQHAQNFSHEKKVIKFKENIAERQKQAVERVRSERRWLVRDEVIPLEDAKELVAKSAWWHTHSSGSPVRAPNHANRVYKSHHGWVIDFGANTFLIGKAIERCKVEVNKHMDLVAQGENPDINELKKSLKKHICGAVANNEGYEYDGYYPLNGNDMMFGAQSIDVKDAAEYLIDKSGVLGLDINGGFK